MARKRITKSAPAESTISSMMKRKMSPELPAVASVVELKMSLMISLKKTMETRTAQKTTMITKYGGNLSVTLST